MKGIDPSGYYVVGTKDGVTKIFAGPFDTYFMASAKRPSDWSWSATVKSGTSLINSGYKGYDEFGILSAKAKSGLESIADSVREYQLQKMQHERELEQIRITAQKEAEERARRERINIFNKTHRNTQSGYNLDNEDIRRQKRLKVPTLMPTGGRVGGAFLGSLAGSAVGGALGGGLLGSLKRFKPVAPSLIAAGAVAGAIGGGIVGHNVGKKSDVTKYAELENERKANLKLATETVKSSYMDEIDPNVYYVIEYNEDAYNKGLHKVVKGFADKTHALNYRNTLRQRGINAFVNKGTTLLAKGVDTTGVFERG